ncbi:MAG: hypothetical protein IJ506_07755 [Clostridia bacterium]|nr:hypothetical protein [Clostridia bacterium]
MPIGKNSIKRAVNNGYSNVKTSAPDMENSEVAIPAPVEVAAKVAPEAVEAVAVKKTTKAPAKKTACKKVADAPTASKTVKKSPTKKATKAEKTSYVNIGGTLPIYLL